MTRPGPRRYSLFTGLLLILLGALFLVNNLMPGRMELGRLWRYWPVLLILLGIAKLLDRLLARRTGQAPPRALTGGEIFLLLLVIGGSAVAIGVVSFAHRHPNLGITTGLWGHPFTFSEELPSQELKPAATVALSTLRGDVAVRSGQDSRMRLIVTKKVASSNWNRASELAKKIQVKVEQTPQGYEVSPQADAEKKNVQVSLEAYLPATTNLSVTTDAGDVRIEGLTGTISATSARGDVQTRNAGGDVTVQLGHGDARIAGVNGNVHLTGRGDVVELGEIKGAVLIEGEFFGPVRIHEISRSVRYTSNRTELTVGRLPGRLEMDAGTLTISDTPADVQLTTRDRDIEVENVTGQIKIENRNGQVEVRFSRPPRADVTISNESGDVNLVLPRDTNAQISAVSRSGSVESDFEAPSLKRIEQGGSTQLNGALGAGGPKISITTTYGAIHLQKAD
jgi:DUF4097 and DUF4098 domain-containing protein YvlB